MEPERKKVSTEKGVHTPEFSTGMKYYINTYSSANTPAFISIYDATGKQIRVLEKNEALVKKMAEFEMSKKNCSCLKLLKELN